MKKDKMLEAYMDPSKLEVIPKESFHDEIDIVVAPVNNQWEATITSIDNRSGASKATGGTVYGVLRNLLMDLPKDLKPKKSWSPRVRSKFLQKTGSSDIHIWCGRVDFEGIGDTFMAAAAYKGESEGVWFGKTLVGALEKLIKDIDPKDFGKRWLHDEGQLVGESTWEEPF